MENIIENESIINQMFSWESKIPTDLQTFNDFLFFLIALADLLGGFSGSFLTKKNIGIAQTVTVIL